VTPAKTGPVPAVRVFNSAAQALPGGNLTMSFNSERYDSANMHNPGDPTRLVAPIAGLYMMTANVQINNAAGTRSWVGISMSAAGFIGSNATTAQVSNENSVTTVYRMNAGQSVQLSVCCEGATGTGDDGSSFALTWLAP
jgi:hypothetical protein